MTDVDAVGSSGLAEQVAMDMVTMEDPQLSCNASLGREEASAAPERSTGSQLGLEGSLTSYALLKEASSKLCVLLLPAVRFPSLQSFQHSPNFHF